MSFYGFKWLFVHNDQTRTAIVDGSLLKERRAKMNESFLKMWSYEIFLCFFKINKEESLASSYLASAKDTTSPSILAPPAVLLESSSLSGISLKSICKHLYSIYRTQRHTVASHSQKQKDESKSVSAPRQLH